MTTALDALKGGRAAHFIGIGGTGMSAVAQLLRWKGSEVSGSDRALDRLKDEGLSRKLGGLGIRLYPQDGSGIGPRTGCVVCSTAVEEDNPDLEAARRLGLPRFHRSEVLSCLAGMQEAVAVTGSSGKSTVSALIAHILMDCGMDPAVAIGACMVELEEQGLAGNARDGRGRYMVMEADESDSTLARYSPAIGVITAASRDHAELEDITGMFREFALRCSRALVLNAGSGPLRGIAPGAGAAMLTYSLDGPASLVPSDMRPLAGGAGDGTAFELDGTSFRCPMPGLHNVSNALAAIAAGRVMGIADRTIARAVGSFRGLRRRLELVGEANGVRVMDDFAHSPAKITAAIRAVSSPRGRTLAVYQPHGYGPTRFHRDGLVRAFADGLRPCDLLFVLPVYDAGGTADRSISSRDLAGEGSACYIDDRARLPGEICAAARPGDTVLVMGARDRTLPELARHVLEALRSEGGMSGAG